MVLLSCFLCVGSFSLVLLSFLGVWLTFFGVAKFVLLYFGLFLCFRSASPPSWGGRLAQRQMNQKIAFLMDLALGGLRPPSLSQSGGLGPDLPVCGWGGGGSSLYSCLVSPFLLLWSAFFRSCLFSCVLVYFHLFASGWVPSILFRLFLCVL